MKPLLVGEANPYGASPAMALYPLPEGASGDRLCRLIMRLKRGEYMQRFDRVNLCPERWSQPQARSRAAELLAGANDQLVLLGSKVCSGFGLEYLPFTSGRFAGSDKQYVILPHPSGLCRTWNNDGAYDMAHAALRAAGIL
ncbi:MAG: hypothetical protein PHS14_07630 [Elusimicrobia bacterium]|nr:hypothetical protein [Elusimicrobiota bacterium]